jgi:hypothetical protein
MRSSKSREINRFNTEVEQQIPEGTRILTEEERVEVLAGLLQNKEKINMILEHMPISLKTMAVREKKDKLEKQLSEIESAIITFSQKIVYINKE